MEITSVVHNPSRDRYLLLINLQHQGLSPLTKIVNIKSNHKHSLRNLRVHQLKPEVTQEEAIQPSEDRVSVLVESIFVI